MDYFVIAMIEELEKIANANMQLKFKQQQQLRNALNNNANKKQLASKASVNNKPQVQTPEQQNAVQSMENMKNA